MGEVMVGHHLTTLNKPQYNFDTIPEELKHLPRWVMWKGSKEPYNCRTGNRASSTDPITWGTFDQCHAAYETGRYSGIGFVLTGDDDIICIDLDDKTATGKLDEFIEISREFHTFAEISQSGTGIHIWCRGRKPGDRCRRGDLEIYEWGRFIAVTGNQVVGSPDTLSYTQEEINRFYERVKPEERPTAPRHTPDAPVELSDGEIIKLASKHSHGFSPLWRGDFSRYPSQSEADAALTLIFAWYTKCEYQIDRLFRQSGLYREKWNREDYRIRTISSALQKQTGQYDPNFRKKTLPSLHLGPGEVQPISWAPGSCPLTDLGNAERFVKQFGDDIRYCDPYKSWYVWTGEIWERDTRKIRDRLAVSTVRAIYAEAAEMVDEKDRKRIADWAKVSESHQKREAILKTVASFVAITPDIWDAKPELFNLQNGTYNLKTHEFREHRKEDFLTCRSYVDFIRDAKCPTWERHLSLIFNEDQDLISGFQELAGYSLLSGNPSEIFCICWGNGRNGKGKTFDALSFIHGDYARNVAFNTFVVKKNGNESTNDIARLKGSRFVRASESEEGDRLSESLIKSLSGGDTITARLLYQENEEFQPDFLIFLQTNHKPIIRNWDQAIEARLWLIPFTKYIEEQDRDHHIVDKLKAEGSGIFNWIIEGLKRYQDNGRLHKPAAVKTATEEYRSEQDRLGEFIRSLCNKGKTETCYRKEIFEAYQRDCAQNGIEALSQNMFGRLLQSHHGVVDGTRDAKGRRWKGISLKTNRGISVTTDTIPAPSVDNGIDRYGDVKNVSQPTHSEHKPQINDFCPENRDKSVTNDPFSSKYSSRDITKRKLLNQVTGVTSCHNSLSSWTTNHHTPALPAPSEYGYLSGGVGTCWCVIRGCTETPIRAVKGNHPLCQKHFKEYSDLWEKEHQEVGQ